MKNIKLTLFFTLAMPCAIVPAHNDSKINNFLPGGCVIKPKFPTDDKLYELQKHYEQLENTDVVYNLDKRIARLKDELHGIIKLQAMHPDVDYSSMITTIQKSIENLQTIRFSLKKDAHTNYRHPRY